jgi:hypothetical protein
VGWWYEGKWPSLQDCHFGSGCDNAERILAAKPKSNLDEAKNHMIGTYYIRGHIFQLHGIKFPYLVGLAQILISYKELVEPRRN